MNIQRKIAFFIYIANIIAMLIIGMLFEFRNEFMPFHSDVIQTQWQNVGAQSQILYLGMMRTEAAGFLAASAALAFLSCIPFRRSEKWSYWAMTTVGVIEYLPTSFANYHVASVTNASPPWLFMLILVLSLLLALVLSLVGHNTQSIDNTSGAG